MSDLQNNSSNLSYETIKHTSKIIEEKPLNNSSNCPEIKQMANEENPTHFLELNNSSFETDVKLIKVKIIVPKGTLTNSKFDHKSNVLTVMNEIDRIRFHVRATTEHSTEVLKITNLFNSDEVEVKYKEQYDEKVELNQKQLGRPKNNYPLMGTNALLAKSNYEQTKDHETEEQPLLSDSDIVQKLVTERYQDSMIELYQRNYKRQTSRTTSEASVDNDLNSNFVNNIKHSSTMLNDRQEPIDDVKYFHEDLPSLENCSIVDILDEIIEVEPSVHLKSTETVFSTTDFSTSRSTCADNNSFNSSDFNVDVTLGSTINFILATNGNGLDECLKQKSCYQNNSLQELKSSDSTDSKADTPQSKSDFDEDKFLQRALGEELIGYVSADSGANNAGAPELDTNDISCVSSRSVNSSDISNLLSKASSLYSVVSSKIRRLSRRLPLQSSEGTISEEDDEEMNIINTSGTNERMSRLMQESVVQYQIMMQTAKALGYCTSVKEFIGSVEQVEAEKMLLLATCKRQAILDVIRKHEYEEEFHAHPEKQDSGGTITISNLIFHPTEGNLAMPKNNTKVGSHNVQSNNQWFVCIVNCNEFTYGTEAKMVDKEGFVRFNERFQFEDLEMDFDLNISLYMITLKNNMRNYSHESKYHLKDTKSSTCPRAPSKLFLQHLTLARSGSTKSNIHSTKHSCIPFGASTLRLNHLINNNKKSSSNNSKNQSHYYHLAKMPAIAGNQLSGIFSAEVATALEVKIKAAGFMTIGHGKTTTWSRHWCELEGTELSWWNYPPQNSMERKGALGSIDLRTCVTARITAVDRNICARPRTLLIETANPPLYNASSSIDLSNINDDNMTRHLLSCDNAHELRIWEKKLNTVLGILRSWNEMASNMMYEKKDS